MRRQTEQGRGMGVGMASVLVIVMTLALTTFGILSLVSARTEAGQSRKLQETLSAYYEAEARLQEQLCDTDEGLLTGTAQLPADGVLELVEEVREGQELYLVLKVNETGSDRRYTVSYQRLVNTGTWNPESGLNLWDGTK